MPNVVEEVTAAEMLTRDRGGIDRWRAGIPS
jgi:hypothetical protein